MVTRHSIDLTRLTEPCFALVGAGESRGCRVLSQVDDNCCTYRCKFYKPKMCKSWIRVEDRTGINLIPPEEALGRKTR